ncbi:hypothetical protein TNCV_128791 [Trichonephila clavipes]|nr:hypothetical protein TNCV_128791 [Trichonephila clavipes]
MNDEPRMFRLLTVVLFFNGEIDLRTANKMLSIRQLIKKIATDFFQKIDNSNNLSILDVEKYIPDPNFNTSTSNQEAPSRKCRREQSNSSFTTQKAASPLWPRETQANVKFFNSVRDGEPLARVPLMARGTIFWARHRSKRSTAIDSSIKEFSVGFSQFKELLEAFKFIMYPDVTSFELIPIQCWKMKNLKCNLLISSLVQYGFKTLLKQGKS